ncbi:hypothetical protein WN944_029243 [Citrus x changshan-huyou]|uniref:Uncharacterized protein n=1 Tax=Citrus x changshan-huyou TaxID=2935761 RepID=A0AAP0LS68_9ROSI
METIKETVETENEIRLITVKEDEEEEKEASPYENSNGGGPSSSSSSMPTLATIKEEEEEEEEGAVDDELVSGGSLPKPMEGLNEVGLPPFLRKIYEMVEDPETDPVVSWINSATEESRQSDMIQLKEKQGKKKWTTSKKHLMALSRLEALYLRFCSLQFAVCRL